MSQSVNRMNGGPAIRADSGMVATLHQHSALHRGIMLDWLRHCDEAGEPHPSNEAIAARFGLPIEAARTLLADLADRGEIRITYARSERQITLAPVKPKRDIGTPRLLPASVRRPQKPHISEEECFARIKLALGRKPVQPPVEPQPQPAIPPPVAAPEEPPMPELAPKHKAPSAVIVPTTTSLYVSAPLRRRIIALTGGDVNCPTVRMLVEEALSAREAPVTLTGKPTVPAAVLRAANAVGADLHDFCSTLLRIGLAAYDRGER